MLQLFCWIQMRELSRANHEPENVWGALSLLLHLCVHSPLQGIFNATGNSPFCGHKITRTNGHCVILMQLY